MPESPLRVVFITANRHLLLFLRSAIGEKLEANGIEWIEVPEGGERVFVLPSKSANASIAFKNPDAKIFGADLDTNSWELKTFELSL